MKIGLWSDCHHFPSLPLIKLSVYHKSLGDSVSIIAEHFYFFVMKKCEGKTI